MGIERGRHTEKTLSSPVSLLIFNSFASLEGEVILSLTLQALCLPVGHFSTGHGLRHWQGMAAMVLPALLFVGTLLQFGLCLDCVDGEINISILGIFFLAGGEVA